MPPESYGIAQILRKHIENQQKIVGRNVWQSKIIGRPG